MCDKDDFSETILPSLFCPPTECLSRLKITRALFYTVFRGTPRLSLQSMVSSCLEPAVAPAGRLILEELLQCVELPPTDVLALLRLLSERAGSSFESNTQLLWNVTKARLYRHAPYVTAARRKAELEWITLELKPKLEGLSLPKAAPSPPSPTLPAADSVLSLSFLSASPSPLDKNVYR